MADYLVDILGDVLYTKPVDDGRTELPSPKELAGKVLVKAKKLKQQDSDGIKKDNLYFKNSLYNCISNC